MTIAALSTAAPATSSELLPWQKRIEDRRKADQPDGLSAQFTNCDVRLSHPWAKRTVRMRLVQNGDQLPDRVKNFLLLPGQYSVLDDTFRNNYKKWVARFNKISKLQIQIVSSATGADWYVLAENHSVFGTLDAFTTYPDSTGATYPYVVTSWKDTVAHSNPTNGSKFDVGVGAEILRGTGIPDPPDGCNERYNGDSIADAIFSANLGATDYGRDDKRVEVKAYGPK